MKTLATLFVELDFGSDKNEILLKLPLLAEKINSILLKIKSCETIEQAEYYFALLERIQNLISTLKFNKEIEIWGDLWNFARKFERIDDYELQKYRFDEIKTDNFPLISMTNLL